MATFFSVQSAKDAARLAAGGSPWPTGLRRANLGIGLYAWDSRETADRYRELLQRHGASDLRIVVYEVTEDSLGQFNKLDLTALSDDEVNAWLEKYSHYGNAESHGWEYVMRLTEIGIEHYFAPAVFTKLVEVA
jgi:hypothetical protein